MMDTSSSFLRTLPLPTPSSSTVTEPPSGQKKIYASTSTQSEENYSHAGSDANQPAIVEIEENSGSSSSHSLMNARRMSYFPTALPPARRTSSMAQEIMRRTSVAITDPTAVYDREGRQGSVFQEAHRKFSSVTSNMGSKRVTHAKPVMHMASKITAILDAERAEKNRRMSLGRSAGTGRASVVAQKQEAGVKYFMDENGVIRCDRGQQMEEGDILQFSELEEICAEFTKEADLCKLFVSIKTVSRFIASITNNFNI